MTIGTVAETARRWDLKRHPSSVRGKAAFIGMGPRLDIMEHVRVREDIATDEDIVRVEAALDGLPRSWEFDTERTARAVVTAVFGGER